jgi:uncharacterized protein YjbJ (UPF0337 family)
MLTERQFELNWGEIKGGLRNLWGALTDEELEEVRGNLYEVSSIVEGRYGESKTEIRHKIDQLLASFDNETDAGLDPDVSSYHRGPLGDGTDRSDQFKRDFDSERNARH